MYNLQGIISKSTNNALLQFERFGQIANNLANVQTTGYKSVSFEQILKEDSPPSPLDNTPEIFS